MEEKRVKIECQRFKYFKCKISDAYSFHKNAKKIKNTWVNKVWLKELQAKKWHDEKVDNEVHTKNDKVKVNNKLRLHYSKLEVEF